MGLYLLCFGVPLLFALWAQSKVRRAFGKYSQVGNSSNMTGAEAAATMLRNQGLRVVESAQAAKQTSGSVAIESVGGFLTDHYDPRSRVLRLSPNVYNGRSLASVGVACHEAGHALQHAHGYAALELRTMMVPVASFGSWAAFPLILMGMIMNAAGLILAGIIVFTAIVAFQIVTLPVEFNATSRAKEALYQTGVIRHPAERQGVASVLDAAALTYVAATVSSIATLLYYVTIFSGGSRD
ncbi:zinc metallopeptidase [Candidatus Sumerlaeota bacterium]|nr:zinc metallopeptidase [Candidatus Sumerlaeota bacterium]